MFEKEALLIVEDHFLISGRGLVLVPLLDPPTDDRRFKPFSEEILIRRPNGSEERFSAHCAAEHFYRSEGKSSWHIVLMLPTGTKETIPIGSQVFVTEQAHARIRGEPPNQSLQRTAGGPGGR